MRKLFLGIGLLPLCLGCVELDIHMRDAPPRPVTPVSAIAVPVTADQVTPANARQVAQSLWDEFDREDLPPPVATEKRK